MCRATEADCQTTESKRHPSVAPVATHGALGRASAPQQEKPGQQPEVHAPQRRGAPARQPGKAHTKQQRPSTARNKEINLQNLKDSLY